MYCNQLYIFNFVYVAVCIYVCMKFDCNKQGYPVDF